MKKSLLFVMPSMASGGGERSLLTLLTLLNYEKYDVDLFLFNRTGLFLDMLPEQVNVLPLGKNYETCLLPPLKILAKGRPLLFLRRMLYSLTLRTGGSTPLEAEQKGWKHLKKIVGETGKEYDAAIAYLEGSPIYFVADCVRAKTKIAYIHNDYSKLGLNAEFDRPYFGQFDFLVSVSPECSKVLTEIFPEYSKKIRTIENIVSPASIKKMAALPVPEYENIFAKKLLTIGRLFVQKGYDLALDAAEKMAADGVDFKWFSIGRGELHDEIEEKIKSKNLQDKFILLGERANPYPYIEGCDIYVQPSRYEGKSIALDEVKCLAKPIVATKFSTVFDQLSDEKTALLSEMNSDDIAAKIEELLSDEIKQKLLAENLKNEKLGNEEELQKFYEMLGELQ